ncbi:MAG: hypothetical protein JWN86_1833 [Planctomycetota bacterium]|nr:hypothetical protein [Planctomycetota bacterium]
MRCDEVMRELSAPGGLDESSLAEHLSACPRCMAWSAQVDKLNRVWNATRPEEPSSSAFDTMWAKTEAMVSEPEILPFVSASGWKRWGLALVTVAQAAVILIAGMYGLSRPTPAIASMHDYRVEEGTTLVVRLDGSRGVISAIEVRPQRGESDTDMVAADLDVLNYMESGPFE